MKLLTRASLLAITIIISSAWSIAQAYSSVLPLTGVRQEIVDNKPDAVEFIQTDGQVRSARLDALMSELRKQEENVNKSDTELVIEIINFQID